LRDESNFRSTFRFSARITPMRASINCGDSAFNYRSAGAIPEILDFPNLVHRNSRINEATFRTMYISVLPFCDATPVERGPTECMLSSRKCFYLSHARLL
jgi:hypothetical protein